ncbi:MAG: ABC transporter substrate-binding protein [Parasporobacterium sp.]|nr:ABC transporter substrate-binding protein [Parasporobacterium sp.]
MKAKHKILSTVLISALAATLTAGIAFAGENSIKVGGLWAQTGWFDSYDVAGSKGLELALDEINAAGGIDGIQVEYVTYDTTSDLATATALTTRMIEQDGCDVLIGMGDPNTDIACGTIAQEYGVPTIATVSTLPYTQERVGDTAFLVPYGDNIQAAAMSEYAYNELGVRTAYVITNNTDEYTLALSKYFQSHFTALGGTIVSEGEFGSEYDDNTSTDFSPIINQILALDEQPDAIFLGCFTDEGPIQLKQIREAGLDVICLSGDGLDDLSVAQIAGAASNNTYFSTHVNYADPITDDFIAAYQAKYNEDPQNAFAALAYDAGYLLKYAIENYANGDYSPQSIRNAIAQVTDFEGLTGTISYADGNVPNKTVFINEFKDGESLNITAIVPTFTEGE